MTGAPAPGAAPERASAAWERVVDAPSIAWALILVGAVLRIAAFLSGRSLWVDEAMLALDIVGREIGTIFAPLAHEQAAPPGFLALVHAAIALWGDDERGLRLVPLLGGLASLPLFAALARRLLAPRSALLALALFAVVDPAVAYAAELKPYATDVALTLALLVLAFRTRERGWSAGPAAIFALLGAAAIGVSFPATLVLAGVGAAELGLAVARRATRDVVRIAAVGGVWLASLCALFRVVRPTAGSRVLHDYWSFAFAPLPPHSLVDLLWWKRTFFEIFDMPGGIEFVGLAGFLFLVGALDLARSRRDALLVLLAPLAVALGASAAHVYPFGGRPSLYLGPILLLLVCAGVQALSQQLGPGRRPVVALLVLVLASSPVVSALRHLVSPREKQELASVLRTVQSERSDADTIYVYYGAQYAYQYYAPRMGLPLLPALDPFVVSDDRSAWRRPAPSPEERIVLGPSARLDWNVYLEDLERLRGRGRVWFVFSHVWRLRGTDEERLMLFWLDRMGRRLREAHATEASVFLYEL